LPLARWLSERRALIDTVERAHAAIGDVQGPDVREKKVARSPTRTSCAWPLSSRATCATFMILRSKFWSMGPGRNSVPLSAHRGSDRRSWC
jgi:hypothetical protein